MATSTAVLAVDSPSAGIHTYPTALTQMYGSPYPVTGSLELSDDGSHVWMDLGASGSFKIDGHFEGSQIVGSTLDPTRQNQLKFVATSDTARDG